MKKVTIKYELGHSIESEYDKTELYCPSCGKQGIWMEQSEGDFYAGPDYACINCYASFNLPALSSNKDSYTGEQLIKQLKSN